MAKDVAARTKSAVEGVAWRALWKNSCHFGAVLCRDGCLCHPRRGRINNRAGGEFIVTARTLVPELGAWCSVLILLSPPLRNHQG